MNKVETIIPTKYEHLLQLMDGLEQAAIDDMALYDTGGIGICTTIVTTQACHLGVFQMSWRVTLS